MGKKLYLCHLTLQWHPLLHQNLDSKLQAKDLSIMVLRPVALVATMHYYQVNNGVHIHSSVENVSKTNYVKLVKSLNLARLSRWSLNLP